jgi:hypothetical protein
MTNRINQMQAVAHLHGQYGGANLYDHPGNALLQQGRGHVAHGSGDKNAPPGSSGNLLRQAGQANTGNPGTVNVPSVAGGMEVVEEVALVVPNCQ